MSFFPIIRRELLARSRSRSTYWTRSAIGLLGVLVCLQSMLGVFGNPTQMGRYVFNGVLCAAFLVSCCVCLLTADAISAERREGTLNLLFLTRVKALDVLLGKLGSVGMASACAVVALLPVLMVPVLAGGVTGGEAVRKGLTLLDTLFLALVAGMFASAAQQERFRAVRTAVLVVFLVIVVPFLPFVVSGRFVPHYLGLFSPLVQVLAAGDLEYQADHAFYWISFVLVQLVAWGLLVWAAVRLRRAVNEEERFELPSAAKAQEHAERALGLGSWQPVKEEAGPVEWLVYRQYGVGAGLWAVALLGLAAGGWVGLARRPAGGYNATMLIFWPVAIAGGLLGGAVVAWVSSRFFVRVRKSGDLELLLTTPVGAESIISEQWKVMKRIFVWPVLVMQAPMLPQLFSLLDPHGPGASGFGESYGGLYRLLNLANTYFGVSALCWLGLWFGLKARTQPGALIWTVGLGKVLPNLVVLSLTVLGAGLATPGARTPAFAQAAGSWLPEMLNLGLYIWLIQAVKRRLAADLTEVDAAPMDLARTFLGVRP